MADTKPRGLAFNLAHPIEEALNRFTLIGGVGDGEQTACAMSLLNWIWGDSNKWTDSPECVHPLIRVVVITANDASDTTPEMRAELVRLGERGALDTWWVPDVVVTASLAAPIGADPPGDYDRAVGCLVRIAAWKDAPVHERPNLADATLARANLVGATLVGANLAGANLVGANLARANLARATLAGADLARATLAGANLARATLAGADLADAILAGADLTRATLAGADLTRATLAGATLAGADLADAILAGAILAGAILARVNLARATLADAILAGANLVGATGNEWTRLPAGWKVDGGVVVRDAQ